jgi:hypothetical protein
MPYIKPEDRSDNMLDAIAHLADEINTKGDLNFVVCELLGQLILKTKISYTQISNWIDALPDAEDEARRRLLHPYEDKKKESNGDVPSFIEVMKIINKL